MDRYRCASRIIYSQKLTNGKDDNGLQKSVDRTKLTIFQFGRRIVAVWLAVHGVICE